MSILKQQKRLWFLAGAAASGIGFLTLEREAFKGAARVAAKLPGARLQCSEHEAPAPVFGPQFWGLTARKWNEAVDSVFQPAIKALCERGL